MTDEQQAFYDFVRAAIQIRRTQPVFQRRKFFQGRAIHGEGIQDISWFDPSGQEMTERAWNTGYARCLGVRLAGDLIGELDERGEPVVGDTILLLMNAHHEAIPFTLPPLKEGQQWERLLDTAPGTSAVRRRASSTVARTYDGRADDQAAAQEAWQAPGTAPLHSEENLKLMEKTKHLKQPSTTPIRLPRRLPVGAEVLTGGVHFRVWASQRSMWR